MTWLRRGDIWALLILLLLSGYLRLRDIGKQSVWFDELVTLEQSAGPRQAWAVTVLNRLRPIQRNPTSVRTGPPLWKLWAIQARANVHPPLFFVWLCIWRHLAPDTDAGARLWSVIASLTGLVFLYLLGQSLYGPTVARWACVLMAISVSDIAYSVEIRPYATVTALSIIAMWLLVRIEQRGATWTRVVALGAVFLVLPLLHYFALGGLVGIAVYGLIRLPRPALRRVALAAGIAAGLFLATWGPYMWQQRHVVAIQFPFLEGSAGPVQSVLRVVDLPLRFMDEPRAQTGALDQARSDLFMNLMGRVGPDTPQWVEVFRRRVLFAITWLPAILLLVPILRLRRRPDLLLPLLWYLGAVGLVLGVDLVRATQQLHYIRYILMAAPAMFLLVPAMFSDLRWVHVLPTILLLYGLQHLGNAYQTRNENWRGAAAAISTQPDAPIVLAGLNRDRWYVNMSYVGITYYNFVPGRLWAYLEGRAPQALADQLRQFPGFWVLCKDPVHPADILPGAHVMSQRPFGWIGQLSWVRLDPTTSRPAPATPPARPALPRSSSPGLSGTSVPVERGGSAQ